MKAIVLFALAACALALTSQNDPFWIAYKQKFGKVYSAEEDAHHYAIFVKSMAHYADLNEIDTASYGWTKFSDQEDVLHLLNVPSYIRRTSVAPSDALPESLDWREKGAVNEVKDQANCGSCWAFCTVVSFEGAYFVEHKKLLSLSEQQLVDCDTNDHGCEGGWPTHAMDFVKENGGIMLEEDYPYQGVEGTCKFDKTKAKMQVKSVHTFSARNEKAMMTAVDQYGPLAVAIDASKFYGYSSGIMNGAGCSTGAPNHGVAVVGWGVEDSTKFWIVRNSWGKTWGENGYVRIERGTNACGIEDYPMGVVAK